MSFENPEKLKGLINTLPPVPEWKAVEICMPGAETTAPIIFYYRDGLECFQNLFSDPTYADHTEYIPKKIWEDNEKTCRVFDSIMTGDKAWDVQV